ncbi:MAG: carboxylating nicotinate-nucleotide diphosphorylase [Flavobacteriales bacterium]|nr:carboxylating nicotinate-nucleotide diphosphorylase [Flavobacteriales bacterium]MBP9080097.1 carboxylating nicotinate-nucleotide diphosphorylase [Flavobacteriales bacterium]
MLPEGTEELIQRAFAEDVGDGDHTSLATVPATARGAAHLLVKDKGILAGVEMAQAICSHLSTELHLRPLLLDGAHIVPGDIAFTLQGPSRSILLVERVLLNFMQRMSGIATLTRAFVEAIEGTGCRVLDTRKTTPGLRSTEKWAVRIGGGMNHRMGLHDMMMIKDNHADFAGGIPQAIARAKAYQQAHNLAIPIEVETRNRMEVEQVLAAGGVQRIMLDNFQPADLRKAVQLIGGRFETEASGGITLATARTYAECRVDFISVGALTHSVPSLDLSLKAMG